MPCGAIYPNGFDMFFRDEKKEFYIISPPNKMRLYRIGMKIYRTNAVSISLKAESIELPTARIKTDVP